MARIIPVDRPTTLERLIAEGVVSPARSAKRPAPEPLAVEGTVSDLVARPASVIAYLDTSAFVPRLFAEPSSGRCGLRQSRAAPRN